MAELGVMQNEPRYKLEEFVEEIAGRRDQAMIALAPQLKSLILGLVDQFAAMKKHDPDLSFESIRFHDARWIMSDGVLVIGITHNKRPFLPREARWY